MKRAVVVGVCRIVLVLLMVCLGSRVGLAQARDARITVSVVDPTGGLIPGASVTLIGLDAASKASPPPAAAKTNAQGVVTLDHVVPGRYSIQAEFPGFDLGLVRDVRITTGDNKRVVMLPFKNLQESVSVGGGQESASSRSTAAFGLALSDDQIVALSDDPNELQQQISDLGGPDAIIRVDSFEGQQLPPKSQIKSIHVTRDQFAAETEQPGSTFVDIITAPGVGALRGGANLSFHDGRMNGHNPFLGAGTATPEQQRVYGANVSGSIVKNRADFSLSINGQNQYTHPILNHDAITDAPAYLLSQKQGVDYASGNGYFNYALTRDQTLKVGFTQAHYTWMNESLGGYSGPDQGTTEHEHYYAFRVQEAGPIGRRVFINSRLNVSHDDDVYQSAVEALTIRVPGATTQGGAQTAGGVYSRNFTFASDVDYVRGINSWRTGVQISGGSYRTDQRSNYLGTYTFASLPDYLAGTPTQFSIETGNPAFSYFNAQGAVYLQDDIRVRKSLTLSPGVRYSAQTRIHDPGAFEPRFGVTWAPSASGKTTLRASAGTFHGWLSTYVLAQSIRLDGTHEQQLLIANPTYPTPPDTINVTVAPTKYEIGSYQLQGNVRYSAGIDQVLSPRLRISVLYNYIHQKQIPRGNDLNPLVDGVRADPAFGSIVETVTDAQIRRHELFTTFNFNLAPQGAGASGKRLDWRRLAANGSYSVIRARRNAGDAFTVPPSGTLDTEWGPGPADAPYRINAAIVSTQIRNVSINLNVSLSSGRVYTETTGLDDNGDGFFNDRPAGVGLNSLRQPGVETLSLRISYQLPVGTVGGPGAPSRYRPSVFVSVNNLTNHVNYTGYSGNLLSGDFGQPTAVQNPRSISMGFNTSF